MPDRAAYAAQLALAQARAGNRAEAQRLLKILEERATREYIPGFQLAIVYAALAEKGASIRQLERAYHEQEPGIANILVEPFWFTSLAGDQCFDALVRKVSVPTNPQ